MTLKMTLKWMAALGVGLLAVQASAEETLLLNTQKEKMSYSLGADMGRNLKWQGVDLDVDVLVKGLRDGLSGEKLLIDEVDLRTGLAAFQSAIKRKQATARMAADENKKKGEAFLAENKTKEGVVTLPSGLQYKVLKMGDGKKPTEADTVVCRYRGTFIDGIEFDNSDRTGQAVTLKVSGVIPGWREALMLMPVGSKWQIFVPAELAYGGRGAGGNIGPNTTLIFELELLGIQ